MFFKSLWFNNYISSYLLEGNENNCPQKDFYKNPILFIIAPKLQQSKRLSADNWINRLQYIDKIEHYSATTTEGMNF